MRKNQTPYRNDFPPPLTREEEQRAFARYQAGDQAAGQLVVLHNMRFVVSQAARYMRAHRLRDDKVFEDLIQVGAIHLMESLPNYVPEAGRFLSFTGRSLNGKFCRHLALDSLVTRPAAVTESTKHLYYRAGAFKSFAPRSKDGPQDGEILTEPTEPSHADAIAEAEDFQLLLGKLKDMIAALPARKRYIMERRMAGDTLEIIALQIGVTKERVRQVEQEAIEQWTTKPKRYRKENGYHEGPAVLATRF